MGSDASTIGPVDFWTRPLLSLIHPAKLVERTCEPGFPGFMCGELQERVTSGKNVTPFAVLAL